jgi:hypothetical protein
MLRVIYIYDIDLIYLRVDGDARFLNKLSTRYRKVIICKKNILSFKTTLGLRLATVVSTSKLRTFALANMTIY